MSNLHLLCIRYHREKSARERYRPEKEDQAIKTPNIKPKSIPENCRPSHRRCGSHYRRRSYGRRVLHRVWIHAGMTSAQIWMAVKMMHTEAKRKIYEKKIASGVTEDDKKRCEKIIEEERKWAKTVDARESPERSAAKATVGKNDKKLRCGAHCVIPHREWMVQIRSSLKISNQEQTEPGSPFCQA